MTIKTTLKTSLTGLKTNKSRSALTILGIVIGITAIILVMSVGQGAKNLILNQVKGFGSQIINIEPGREPKGMSDFAQMFTDSLKEEDVVALRKLPGVKNVVPNVFQAATVVFENEAKKTTFLGASDLIAEALSISIGQGRFFDDEEVKQYSNVAVIGSELKKDFFGLSDAIGEKIKIKNRNFKIIGVLAPKGKSMTFDVDKVVIIPYTTAQKYLMGINYYNGGILVKAESEEIMPQLISEIKIRMRELHNITDPEKDDFHIVTQADAAKAVGSITTILTALLGSIAAVSLIVGGIGIMNIMLVSVTERTREIGLRKAVGATNKDILNQFLLESVVLTLIGGIIGIALGAIFSFLTSLILGKVIGMDWSFTFPVFAAFLGLGVSAFIGLVFGLYPARRAASLNPIEALRYE